MGCALVSITNFSAKMDRDVWVSYAQGFQSDLSLSQAKVLNKESGHPAPHHFRLTPPEVVSPFN